LTDSEKYILRCIELAKKGAGYAAPNPMVGAVLVYNERIIGESWHQKYGEAHAEVNCINAVKEEDRQFIAQSTLYVSLEPCAHAGKTPPCTNLIIVNKIPRVVIGCRDAYKEVDGKGIKQLQDAGVEVTAGILENECKELNKRFFTFHKLLRPYIILKWAQSANGKIANKNLSRVFITNELTNRLVHQWRSEEAAILIGTNTAQFDNPSLTAGLWPGPSPVRLVVDMALSLPQTLHVFNQEVSTVIFNTKKHDLDGAVYYYKVNEDENPVRQICTALYKLNLQSVIVEGGAKLLQSFINEKLFDEIRVIENEELIISDGLAAPELPNVQLIRKEKFLSDSIRFYT
jgi:diaminohydroxyphosphoribosylaminopyrimidine deaminase / 5-amino-6-(5-phosphoribosylamino)uracil reductase